MSKKDFEVYEGEKDDYAAAVWAILTTLAFMLGVASAGGFENLSLYPTLLGVAIPVTAWIAFFRESAGVQRFWAFLSLALSAAWIVLFAVLHIQ